MDDYLKKSRMKSYIYIYLPNVHFLKTNPTTSYITEEYTSKIYFSLSNSLHFANACY